MCEPTTRLYPLPGTDAIEAAAQVERSDDESAASRFNDGLQS